MLSGVKSKDVLALSGAGIDGTQVLAALHFPYRSNYSIFLYSVIRNLFGVCFRRGLGCVAPALPYSGFILRHTNSATLQSFVGCFWVSRLLHINHASATLPRPLFAARPRPSLAARLRRPARARQCRSGCA